MTIRQHNLGSIVKPGFNPLGVQTVTTTYFPYLYSWGINNTGQLGLGNTTYFSSPKQVGSLTNWLKINSGYNFNLSTKTDGTLWSWGYNGNGELGLGNTTNYSSPKQVGSLTNWSNIAGGNFHSLAIKTNGTLWAWGKNTFGQLGLGSTSYGVSSPNQVGLLTNWSNIACGTDFSIATQTNGTLWSWGKNNAGQLGINNITYYSSPKQVGSLTNWSNIAGGNNFVLATKTDGTIWSWGYGNFGALGLNNLTYYSSPKQIGALTNWLKVSSKTNHALAVKTNGTLFGWGRNNQGQLGLGNQTNYSSPKQVGALTNWLNISAGGYNFSISTKTDGTLWSWGRNGTGQLGLGNGSDYSSPKQVGILTTWLNVSCGNQFTTALLY